MKTALVKRSFWCWWCAVTHYQGWRFFASDSKDWGRPADPLASTFFTIAKKWMWFRNVSQSRAIHPGITESQLTVLTAMPRFGDPPPSLPLPDKIWMSESRNTNKSHCPPLCPWITGFLLHIFGDFISKAVWISLVGEISPIWPGACSASLIPDRAPLHWAHMSTLIRYSMQEKIYKSDYKSHCDVKVEADRRRSLSQSVRWRQPRVIMPALGQR